ncbi:MULTISPECIES: class II aldolase/adducin family protein [Marinomonas]|uniref:HCOMODA/2-hydroxy-3-carboxy-muconic semialdehyde decarboxylase n=3 Tax=Marinomonas TaxID=28253 RepID=A0A1M5NCU3_9GAMM|nr:MULTISPECIES: class II aldolase/adducin family protein [Marinomonas]MBR7890305.1 class II aldolase/adducin family protein [Marinomonas vulgaris]RCW98270.1 HCOMODA/2-hydroxy-3-carboxy-muconic semialdehyde decarboxylase [Marinomonas foliarum]SHG87307.1 HCOMODA/2-hydroxy-3-carboxy-muconic semialdehyde decarboxylase [Marinomonas polaris DSM 16579]|tara:strand:- start:675 stop:1418 length:744 start_codon:yes stop_codon:yes gene_type:complete
MSDINLSETLENLVDANLILFNEGVLDAFGHISVRSPTNTDRFYLARNMAPGLVTTDDIIEFDMNGEVSDGDTRKVYLERFIHSEIYKSRPDVMSIVHSHSPSVVPFSVAKETPLRPICHMSGFIGTHVPIFEIRDHAGDKTSLLITDKYLGESLSTELSSNTLVLMRGHGSTVVAPSIKLAVYRAVYVEVNAKLQSESMKLGPIEYLTPGETIASQAANEGQVERPWALWRARARHAQKEWISFYK